jgi:hypothetical protein
VTYNRINTMKIVRSEFMSSWVYSSTMKKGSVSFPEVLVDFYWTTRRHIQEDHTVYSHRRENLKSGIIVHCLFNDAVCITRYTLSNSRVTSKYWPGEHVERSSRGLVWGRRTITEFSWRDWVEPLKSSLEVTGVSAEIRTGNLSYTRQKNFFLSQLAR